MLNMTRHFGNPEKNFKSINVAGTNGKGTVTLKCARSLENAGFKTGLFISPHITCFRERITVNQEKISEEDVAKYSRMIFEAIEEKSFNVTFFEIITMIGLLHFSEQKVDYAVLECGIGGRLDATNIIEKPVCCAIASIGFDHMEVLGDTLELIAE
jgi:dihydrofolate synthase/folylpolyglutamate synthase